MLHKVDCRDHDLAATFRACSCAQAGTGEIAGLEGELRARLDAGRAAWPTVTLDATVFVRYLAERSGGALPPLARSADLYIACACAHAAPSAVDAFGRHYRAVIARAIARTDASDTFLDDVLQALRVKLFVADDGAPPGIAQYGGRSSLRGWLATAATRTALNLRRRKGDQGHDEVRSGIAELNASANPELLLLKARYKSEFEKAIRTSLAALPAEQRTLLLLQVVEGVTLPQLATMHRVSRATVARWLASARQTLFEETRRELTGRLRITASEYESLVALVRSQLEVTLTTVARS